MDVTLSEMLGTFMESPLVMWVRTLGPLASGEEAGTEDRVNMFMELVDGVFLHKIMTQIDPSPTHQRLSKNINNDVALRLHNLTVLVRHIRTYYQETLQQLIVMPLPNILCIAKDPISAKSMEELKRLLLLILGCAVQCERKEEMIEKIKLLDIETQAAIVSHIQEVTHNQLNVLDLSWLEAESELVHEELEPMSRNMAASLRQLIDQRDKANEVIVDLTQERDYLCGQQPQEHCRDLGMSSPERGPNSKDVTLSNGPSSVNMPGLTEEKHHLSVELADTKAKLRRYRQELEEKTEQLMDSKHEVERLDQELQRMRQEHQSLSCEARSARVYRDEVDSLRERASRVDRLEAELMRCKEKLNDVHFYKTRVEELRDDNQTLMETKVLLEEQLSASRGRCDKLHTLEKDNLLLRAKISDLEMERENERRRLEELVEENMLLEIGQKQSMNESAHLGWELEQLSKNHDSNTETRKSLVHELNECVSSRVLKLEKENRELQTSIERLKEDNHSLQEKQLHAQELDRENQSLSNKLERLQGLLDQERMTNQDMESLGEEILKEKQGVEREMHILKAEKDRQILELESEKKHLSDAMAALQERAQANSEARVREVETENRQLHRKITESSSKLVTMETQLKLANEEVQRVKSKASRCEEVEREAVRLERSRDALNREVTSLHACSERSEALEKQVSSLEQEVHRLKCEAEESQKELHRLGKHESEHSLLAKENLELRCSMENLRSTTARLSSLQEEHQEVQKERQELRRKLEEAQDLAQGEKKRAERLEANMASLNHEKHRLEEDLERQKEEREETERENQEMKSREEELRRELQVQRKHWEETDDERRKLQKDFDQSEKSRKHLEKESWRVRTLLETKEADLEEKSRRLATMQKESVALKKEIDRLKELSVKAKEAERENKELQKQVTIDKRMLATLREELVSEKLNFQQQNVELERLNEELEKIGLNREKLLQQEHTMEDRYQLLESRLEETVQQTMKLKEEKISSLEKKLEESHSLNASLRSELNTVRQTLSLKQEQEQNHNSQKHSGNDRGQGSATAELLRIKDHLIDVEKNNASLQTESSLLKEQLKQLENQNNSLNNQISTLQRHTSTLQEQNSGLHTQTAKLQVENSTLSSQSASLMAQNAVLQGQVTALEAEVESWQRQREEAWKGRESVLSDHERLMNVHERQAHEYEALISQHAALKGKQRALESEHRALHNKYCVLLQQKDIWEKQEGQGQKEKEELSQEVQKNRLLVQENLQLKNEMDRMTASQTHQLEQSDGLQQRVLELKTSLSAAQTEAGQWMSMYDSLMEQHQGLDLTMTKLDNHCELLSRLKGNLEEENHHLLSQINLLSQQNHTLLERSMESKELYHQEQKLYIDKLNALRRQKEKLEEKSWTQYKFYDPTPKKKSQWSGAKALAKLIKPRKDTSRERGDREREGFKERERAKSAPDIPLPAPPPLLLPDTPPPVPQRTSSSNDSVQGNSVHGNSVHGNSVHGNSVHGNSVHGNSVHSNSINNTHSSNSIPDNDTPSLGPRSPALTPFSRGLSDRGRAGHRGSTPGDGNENVNGEDSHGQVSGPSYRALSSTPNHQSSSVGLNSTRSAPSRRPRGLLYDEDLRHTSTDSMFGFHGSAGGRPGSADYSHNTSSSNSPVNCKDPSNRQGHSASLSSDDILCVGQSQQSLSRSSTLLYDHSPQKAQPQRGVPRPKTRSASPGSEMVTLEQFLHESNLQSPPVVSTGSREDLMTDYFTCSPAHSTPIGREQATPTSYVTPTVQPSNQRPGQSVKPSPRHPVGQSPASSQTVTQRTSQSLSRTFSLASADLLRSNGPDGFRGNEGSTGQSDVVIRRPGGGASARERPLSARLAGPTSHGDASFLHTPIHHSSSLNLQSDRYLERGRTTTTTARSGTNYHRGEIAMVTPVRAVTATRLDEDQGGGEGPQKKDGDRTRCSSIERPKSTPASPDPNNDPQTVWYEYGCV
ncbi:LOW QUALITY PROTEIN: protein Daple [Periophthalmus magnuspinnatus]|uniref:LOW QUALITY PROTEIN: protein Daple n=1 Tax=Periophthalmus magnuspinnatus TaxID=409849 RepID=UPI002436DE74|nr:LOW QUALITY PROTEIN: protein Daple [Periophthalmus magnuspinnatus]